MFNLQQYRKTSFSPPTKERDVLELLGSVVGLVKSAGFMVDEYKNYLKDHPELIKELTVDQREKLRRSEDIEEMLEIIEDAYSVRIK